MTPTIDSVLLGSDPTKPASGEIRGTITFEAPEYIVVLTGENEYRVPRRIIIDVTRNLSCQWFSLCPQLAVALQHHPALGGVPICQTCSDRVNGRGR